MAEDSQWTRQLVERRTARHEAAIIIDNVVYDVSGFLEEHPGGADVLLTNAGRDASRCFHEVGHSEDALALRERFRLGELVEQDRWPVLARPQEVGGAGRPLTWAALLHVLGPPLAMAALATWAYLYVL
ncbi:cytochrome b5-like [Leptidea sinapis]|uniref:cytochrome b5-like n=1 Tax=Leptidea sinapis TaxID=189913 RepID=UPI0021333FE2|nr:cytochrome b5-like [Leptidea sinapis]